MDITVTGFAPARAGDLYLLAEPGTGAVNSTTGNTPARPDYISVAHSTVQWPAAGPLHVDLPPLAFGVLVLHAA